MPNILNAEEMYRRNKQNLLNVLNGKIDPVQVERVPKSIYHEFAERMKKNGNTLIREMELEVYRNITTYDPKIATKRIMELVWVLRKELSGKTIGTGSGGPQQ